MVRVRNSKSSSCSVLSLALQSTSRVPPTAHTPVPVKGPTSTSVGGPVHGRVSAVVNTSVQGVCGKGSLQQSPQHCSVATCRGQVNGCAAFKVSAQHKCIMVKQGSQAVLTASHCLQGTEVKVVKKPLFVL